MKQLIIADIHIKLGAKNIPISWAKDRYSLFIEKVAKLSKTVDMVLLLGDTFDRIPSLEEMEIYFQLISNISKQTYIIDGNHEASKKGKTFLTFLSEVTNKINPSVNIITEITEYSWGTLLPYCKLHEKGIFERLNKSKPLYTHVRGEIPPHVKAEIDLDLFTEFPIVYSGDLHSRSNSQRNIVYPGSPMTTSFHREEVANGCIIAEGTEYEWVSLELPQLIRKTIEDPASMISTEFHHTIYELVGNITDLSNITDNELLDKKVVKRSTESTLKLTSDMSIEDELVEFLKYILELRDEDIQSIIGAFRDNISKA